MKRRAVINRGNRQTFGLRSAVPLWCKRERCAYAEICPLLRDGYSEPMPYCALDLAAYAAGLEIACGGLAHRRARLPVELRESIEAFATAHMMLQRVSRYLAIRPELLRTRVRQAPNGREYAEQALSHGADVLKRVLKRYEDLLRLMGPVRAALADLDDDDEEEERQEVGGASATANG